MNGKFLVSLASAGLLFGASPSWAATVAIDPLLTNASFETPASGCPTSWTCNGSPGTGFGVYAPTSNQYTAGSDGLPGSLIVPNGSQVAFSPTGLAGSGTMIQSTSTNWASGNDYTFTFWIGLPKKEPDGTTAVTGLPPTIRVYFLEDGVQDGLTAYDLTAAQRPASGQWLQVTLTETAAQVASSGAVGHKIGIEFFVSTEGGNGQAVNFDIGPTTGGGNAGATPLPAALPLFAGGLGVIGLLARRRKRKLAA